MPSEVSLQIHFVTGDDTIAYAASELETYLRSLLDSDVVTVGHETHVPDERGFWVGTDSTLEDVTLPEVEDQLLDDAISVETGVSGGIVSGNSPRAVLLAVYRYLRELGCRWIRPGTEGEIIPNLDALKPVSLTETPAQRHRGITIEGAVSEDHVLDMIEWAPKVGFNSYFFQFFHSATFFDWWYTHENNPHWDGEPLSTEQAREMHRRCVAAVEKRGLVHHAVGHGWTARAVGLEGRGWDESTAELSEAETDLLAKVDGERGVHDDIPTDTELCFSNPAARERMIEEVAEYAADHPEVDLLHVWVSDGHNNHCECAACRQHRPADLYVTLLNELATELDDRGIDTRIAFLAYLDLLWPPETERIEDPDRFHLMFAPIFREYASTYGDVDSLPPLPPFERNDLDYPVGLAENVAFLDAWREVFDGDAFLFDYHLWRYHHNDPGEMSIARVMTEDMRHLSDVGLTGNVSAQTQRAFFPSGLSMAALARTLWDDDLGYEEITESYFRTAFGDDWEAARAYLSSISDAFEPLYTGNHNGYDLSGVPEPRQEVRDSFAAVPDIVTEFLPVLERNRDHEEPARALSWSYLDHHVDICVGLSSALGALAAGDETAARERWEAVKEVVQRREAHLQRGFDVFWFVWVFEQKFGDIAA